MSTPTTPDRSSASTLASDTSTLASDTASRSGSESSSSRQGNPIHRLASTAHETIDRLEQSLSKVPTSVKSMKLGSGSGSGSDSGLKASLSGYTDQARQYKSQLDEQVQSKPLQTAGAVFAAGLVLGKLFMRRTKVNVVRVPLYVPSLSHADTTAVRERAHQWREAASAAARRIGESGHYRANQAGAATLAGLATAKAASSRLWDHTRKSLPSDLSAAREQAAAKTQYYGAAARHQLEEHPLPGVAVAIGLGAAAAALALATRRSDQSDYDRSVPVVRAVDKEGTPFREEYRVSGGRAGGMSAPIASGALVLGLGVILGAMLVRR